MLAHAWAENKAMLQFLFHNKVGADKKIITEHFGNQPFF